MIKRPLLGWVVSFVLGMLCYRLKISYVLGIGMLGWVILFLPGCSIKNLNQVNVWMERNRSVFTKEDWHRFMWPVFFIFGFSTMLNAKQVSQLETALSQQFAGEVYGELTDMKQKGDVQVLLLRDIIVYHKETDQWYEDKCAIVYTKQDLHYSIGNQLGIQGTVQALTKATNPGQFNEYSYYKSRDVICKVFADQMEVTNTKTSLLRDMLYRIRQRLIQQIQTLLPEEEAGLMSAILFGDKSLLSEEIKLLYQKNGLAHIMAVSGLHISLLGYGLYQLLRKLTVPVWLATSIPVIILIFYGALVGSSVSACRAIFMFALMMLSVNLGRWYDMGSALSLAALLLLIKSPLQLFEPGFLFSFTSVTGIAVLYPKLCEAFITPDSKKAKFLKPLLLSTSTWLLTLPVTCYFYFEISIYSIWINLILLPLCSFLILTSLAACVFSFFSLTLGRFVIGSVYYLLEFFSVILHIPEQLPYHLILIGRIPMLNVLGYYLVLFGSYLIYRMEKKRISWFGLVFLILFLLVRQPKGLSITCLDVSQGESIVITANDQVVMIDGGSMDINMVYEYRIKPYLKSMGIRYVDTVFISHADDDHVSGILECLNQMTSNSQHMADYDGDIVVGKIILPKLSSYDKAYQHVIQLATEKKVTIEFMENGQMCDIGGVTYTALHPGKGYPVQNRNNTSLVLWAKCGEFDGLFLGDVDQSVEDSVIGMYYAPIIGESFDLLKVAHHGSRSSTSEKMLNAVRPEVAVISVGEYNRYGHPHDETVEKLRQCGCTIYRTSEKGAILLRY